MKQPRPEGSPPLPGLPIPGMPAFYSLARAFPVMVAETEVLRAESKHQLCPLPTAASAQRHPVWPHAKILPGTEGKSCMMLIPWLLCLIFSIPGGWQGPSQCCQVEAAAHADIYKASPRQNRICSLTRRAPKLWDIFLNTYPKDQPQVLGVEAGRSGWIVTSCVLPMSLSIIFVSQKDILWIKNQSTCWEINFE